MYKFKAFCILLFITAVFSGCSLEEEDRYFKDQVLAGEVLGVPYNFGYGKSQYTLNDNPNKYDIALFSDDSDSSLPLLIFQLDREAQPQMYNISADSFNLSGKESTTNFTRFDKGQIEITTISETEITGRIWAITDEGTSNVNGNFTARIDS